MAIDKKVTTAATSFNRTTRGGGGCGCFAMGCGAVVGIFFLLCVGSYFAMMHSSLPLTMIENALEEDGRIEVEGLRGSISGGFEIDSLKFESDECDEWNELRQVRFSYNGFIDLLRTKRLIISEATIGGATIYATIDGDGDGESDIRLGDGFEGENFAEEIAEEWGDMQQEFQDNDSEDLKELRIDLVGARNVEIVDPNTGSRLEFSKVEFRNYQMLEGRITRPGQLEILSDQLDMDSAKSTRYPDEPVAWKLTGNVKPAASKRIAKDIPYEIDFAIMSSDEYRLHVDLFEGQVVVEEPYGDQRNIRLTDFSPGEYFITHSSLVPSRWNVELMIETSEIEVEVPRRSRSRDARNDDQEKGDPKSVDGAGAVDSEAPAQEASETRPPDAPMAPDAPGDTTEQAEVAEDSKAGDESDPQESGDSIQDDASQETAMEPRTITVKKKIHDIAIDPESTFFLGETRFTFESRQVKFGPDEKMEPARLIATGELDGKPVQAVFVLRAKLPYFGVALEAPEMQPKDIWAQLFFQKDYDSLDTESRREVDKAILAPTPMGSIDDFEPVEF